MNNNEPTNQKLRCVTNLLCETTERNIEIWFCEEEFLQSVIYKPDFDDEILAYLIEHLNDHYWQCCDIEGEEFCDILQPLNENLVREFQLRIESSKYNL